MKNIHHPQSRRTYSLDDIENNARPKQINSYMLNGHEVKVYEAAHLIKGDAVIRPSKGISRSPEFEIESTYGR